MVKNDNGDALMNNDKWCPMETINIKHLKFFLLSHARIRSFSVCLSFTSSTSLACVQFWLFVYNINY